MSFKIFIFVFCILILAVVAADLWMGVESGGFIDDFERADSLELGANWTKSLNTSVSTSSIKDNTLYFNDSEGGTNVEVIANGTTVNGSHNYLEFRYKTKDQTAASFGIGFRVDIRNENFDYIVRVGFNNTGLGITHGTLLSGVRNMTTLVDTYYNVSLKFNFTSDSLVWSTDGVEQGNFSFESASERFGYVSLITGPSGRQGNTTIDYIQWGDEFIVNVNLIVPANNSDLTGLATTELRFNASLIPNIGYNLTNATIYLYNSTDIFNKTTNEVTGNITNSTVWDILGLMFDNYTWNVYGCEKKNVGGSVECGWAGNYSFEYFIQHSQSVDKETIATGDTAEFVLYVNRTSIPITTSKFFYNETQYSPTSAAHTNYYRFSHNLTIPSTFGNRTGKNVTWYWNYTITGDDEVRTPKQNQTVFNLSIDDCSVNTYMIYNFTLRDEELTTIISGNISYDIKLTSKTNSSITFTFSQTENSVKEVDICVHSGLLSGGSQLRTDVMINFDSTLRVSEFYYIQNETMNSTNKKNISLYDLLTADSTSFLFEFEDANENPVKDGIVKTYRKYIGDSLWHIVEVSWLDENGETIVHLVEEDVVYYFEIWKEGTLLLNTSETLALCQAVPCTLSYSQAAAGVEYFTKQWDRVSDGYYVWSASRSMRIVNLTFTYASSHNTNLTVYALSANRSKMDEAINSSYSSNSSGVVEVYVPTSHGNRTYYATFYRDDRIISSKFVDFTIDPEDYFGTTSIIMTAMMVLTLGLIAISSGFWMIIFLLLGLFIAGVMSIFKMPYEAFSYIVVAGVVIIIKLIAKRK